MHLSAIPPSVDRRFSLTVDRSEQCRIALSAAGELDLASVEPLREFLLGAEAAGGFIVHFDLAAVTFMDCSCLGVLVSAHHRLRARGGQILLSPVSSPVARLLRWTRLDRTLLTRIDLLGPTGLVPSPAPRPAA